MKLLKNLLMAIGLIFVISSLIFAVQDDSESIESKEEKLQDEKDKEEVLVGEAKKELVAVELEEGNGVSLSDSYMISPIPIPEDLNFAGERAPQEDPEVRERIDREFLVNTYWQSNAMLLMKRANKYFPIIEPILAKNGVPDDFKYLAVAESGLDNVVSPAKASGFWQIMKATGQEYGLEINKNVDERYNIQKATEVACQYLTKYKNKYGNWTLAAAAYNTGTGSVDRYLRTQKVTDYYDILLGSETGRYVFRIMAIKEILSHPKKYGFDLKKDDLYSAVPTFTVEVDTPVANFTDFAKQYEINYKVFKRHNPWLRELHLNNASRKKYVIEIPNKGFYKETTTP